MNGSGLRLNLDSNFSSEKKKLTYPYIYIPKYGDEIALMVSCIQPGTIPIVLSDGSTLKQVGTCSVSALEWSKLLRVYRFEVVTSPTEKKVMRNITDVMEVLAWMAPLSSS